MSLKYNGGYIKFRANSGAEILFERDMSEHDYNAMREALAELENSSMGDDIFYTGDLPSGLGSTWEAIAFMEKCDDGTEISWEILDAMIEIFGEHYLGDADDILSEKEDRYVGEYSPLEWKDYLLDDFIEGYEISDEVTPYLDGDKIVQDWGYDYTEHNWHYFRTN